MFSATMEWCAQTAFISDFQPTLVEKWSTRRASFAIILWALNSHLLGQQGRVPLREHNSTYQPVVLYILSRVMPERSSKCITERQ